MFSTNLSGWWVGFGCGWAKLNVVFLGRQVRWQNTSLNFAKRWHFRPPFLSVYVCTFGRPTLAPNYLAFYLPFFHDD
jgi:hypothetical protein